MITRAANNWFKRIKRPLIFGMVHVPALPGYYFKNFFVLKNMLKNILGRLILI